MIYLILAILSSAMVAIAMRIGKKYCHNNLSMLAVNYVFCTIIAAYYTATGVGGFRADRFSIGLGALQGIFYLSCFVLFQYNIRKNGVVLSATYMKLGVLVPTLAAIFLFREQPTVVQVAGVALSLCAIVLMNYEGGAQAFAFNKTLLLLLFNGGMSDILAKVYDQYGISELKDQFVLCTFVTALILCTILALSKKEKLTLADVLCGLLLGIPNYFSAIFLLKALHYVMATVTYSTFSVGSIGLTALAGVLLFREKLTRRQTIGLGMILVALVCLNL